MSANKPIAGFDDLLQIFQKSQHPQQLLGTESEKFGVFAESAKPVSYDGQACGILNFFEELCDRYGWQPISEKPDGPIIALERLGPNGRTASVTLEPGAQLELSGAAVETVHEVATELEQHLAEIGPSSAACSVSWLAAGYHPVATQAQLPWVPKSRYAIMREYFPTKGTRGLDMMRRTATVQVNLDYVDEQDAMRKLQLGLKLAPVATAIFANSPFSEGRIHANKTERGAVWLDADPDRTGLLPQMWAPKAGFRDYVEWALDVPMYMFKRPGPTGEPTAVINTGQPFRSFWQDGYEGHRATLEDWHTHLATLFPEARLKSTVELRSADSLPQPLLCALPAFWAGLLYDQTALTAAEELVADWTFEQVQAARPDIARRAVGAELAGRPLRTVAEQVVSLSLEGLARRANLDEQQRDERIFLEPIAELVQAGRSPADLLLEQLDPNAADLRAQIVARTRV